MLLPASRLAVWHVRSLFASSSAGGQKKKKFDVWLLRRLSLLLLKFVCLGKGHARIGVSSPAAAAAIATLLVGSFFREGCLLHEDATASWSGKERAASSEMGGLAGCLLLSVYLFARGVVVCVSYRDVGVTL